MRTPFQRDRDRIVHSKAFRRLKHKTQVFVAPEGDHYRTRLTHTLEACFISRTVARALGLNEDLTEAIGLGHDLGHPPFGHIGEEVLDEALRRARVGPSATTSTRCGWSRCSRARRARAEPDRAGARRDPAPHRVREAGDAGGAGGDGSSTGSPTSTTTSTTRCGRGSSPRATCRPRRSSCWGRPGPSGWTRWCSDMVERSREAGDIVQSEEVGGAMLRLRKFMFDRVYLGDEARARAGAGARGAAARCSRTTSRTPRRCRRRDPDADEVQRVTDYLAGMTDRFCLSQQRVAPSAAARAWETEGMARFSDDIEGSGPGGRRTSSRSSRPYTDLRQRGQGLVGAVPVPRRADAVVLGRPAGQALLLLRVRGGGRRLQLRRGEGGAELPRGASRRWPSATGSSSSARRRTRGPRRRGGSGRGSGSCWSGPPSSTCSYLWESPKAREGARVPAGRGLSEEALRDFGVGMAPQRVGPGAAGRPARRVQGRGARVGGADPEGATGRATTTASARGSRSRSATAGPGARVRRAGADGRTRSRST